MQGKKAESVKSVKESSIPSVEPDPLECPFREFRDSELLAEYWGMGPVTFRMMVASKMVMKQPEDNVWVDEQTQPLPRSVRQYLHGWVKAEELALSRWEEAQTVVFEENGSEKRSIIDMQLSHTQVLQRSAFCRRVLSACFILERADIPTVDHQWENFSMVLPDGWRPKYHIYSPTTKPGGGTQHRPQLSKSGCYLVRLYYVGAWRCVWVSDQVPVDATGAPLLPFSPFVSPAPTKQAPGRQQAPVVTATAAVVHLWPLLLCKALLKLAAPDMNSDEECDSVEDEEMLEFKIVHSLTGAMETDIWPADREDLWERLVVSSQMFIWDAEDDDTLTNKSRGGKKDKIKQITNVKRGLIPMITIRDTKDLPPYTLPGISPGHEMCLHVLMVRDVPLKKPPAEPDVALWKRYRWVDWARRHGLYEAYDFPRTRFLKLIGFLKLSYAPHLLDVQSTETITMEFRKLHDRSPVRTDKKSAKAATPNYPVVSIKEELRDWVLFDNISETVKRMSVISLPSMFNMTSVGSALRITKIPVFKTLDIVAPKSEPMYLQIDSPALNRLKISLNILHPRVMFNCGVPILDYVEPAYLILERLDWFVDSELPRAKAYVRTRGYDTVEVDFIPGRHYCRLWVHSSMNWHVALLSESSLLLGTQDVIHIASVVECPWANNFLTNLGTAFSNLLKFNIAAVNVATGEDFFKAYQPDLTWNDKLAGYKKNYVHWMFRKALQSLLLKRLSHLEFQEACVVLRRYLRAPDFGLPESKTKMTNYRQLINLDPCDCSIKESEQMETEIQIGNEPRRKVSELILDQLLVCASPPATSQVCELATPELLCGDLKKEREKLVRQHEAATLLQAHWRGVMARKCLRETVPVTPEINQCLMESAFGQPEALSALMNEFFTMFPGTKHAYSMASALSGTTGLQTFVGQAPISPKSKWIPYFQGVFFCHEPVKVHFALQGTLQFSTFTVYDNDTGMQLPQVYRAAKMFDFKPNSFGYMVMGHGILFKPRGDSSEAHWQLTVLSSIKNVFHVCDGSLADYCHETPLPPSSKFHIDALYVPNRRNILGGIKLIVTQSGVVSFRAAATSPDLNVVAILKAQADGGRMEVVDKCAGKGELYWPYIKLDPASPPVLKNRPVSSRSHASINMPPSSKKPRPTSANSKRTKSAVKLQILKTNKPSAQAKLYIIELSCPDGWPLTKEQWIRVEDVRNTLDSVKLEAVDKKDPARVKSATSRDRRTFEAPHSSRPQPKPGDAYTELECSVAQGGGITVEDDFSREIDFEIARRTWASKEPGRNKCGARARKEFREQYLDVPTERIEEETMVGENMGEELFEPKKGETYPSPETDSGLFPISMESEEEAQYLNLPDSLKDKFVPLPFAPFCMKELLDENERVLITPEMVEAGKYERYLHIEGALKNLEELQEYNKLQILGQHKNRLNLLNRLIVEASWTPELHQVLEDRDNAVAQEALARNENAPKKISAPKQRPT